MYMYVDICIFMYMYIACTYSSRLVHNFINMYIHVCTMYRALCTDLQILVHVVRVRIPDAGPAGPALAGSAVRAAAAVTGPGAGSPAASTVSGTQAGSTG